MEGLNVADNVISILQLIKSVISACYQYHKAAKGAQKDILRVITIIDGLKSTLDMIKDFMLEDDKDDEDPRLSTLKSLDRSFKECRGAMNDIAIQLGIDLENIPQEDVKITIKRKATWPWKEKEVAKMVQSLEAFQTIFILALNGDTYKVICAIQDSVKDVAESTNKMVRSERQKSILNWLNVTDPSVNHNAAQLKHEPTTGDWLLESEIFTTWKNAENWSMWLYGKPGAGKTILCSTVSEHVKSLCPNSSTDRYAYFYFDFSDAEKQTVSNMLCSFISQLSTTYLSGNVDELYKKCNNGQQRPYVDDLVKTLVSLFSESHRTYLIVDAMDECSERPQLLNSLRKITQTAPEHANLLVTSREEYDISNGLRGVISKSINLECGGLDSDIDIYIRRFLDNDEDWRNETPELKKEVQEALVKKANGM
jgi:NACHT domain